MAVHRALDLPEIEADVRLVRTVVEPDDVRAHSDLAARELRRLFLQRVPVARAGAASSSILSDPEQYPWLAEMVEAWAARLMFAEGTVPGPDARPRGAGTPRSSCRSSR